MTPLPPGVIAIDWSGDKRNARRKIWVAEAKGAQLVRLENGKTPEEVTRLLIDAATKDTRFIVGLDFAFSFPSWFCDTLQAKTAYDVWARAALQGEVWLRCCDAPFWGRPGRTRDIHIEEFRRTERDVPRNKRGTAPKSVFQIGGAGAVGTGSIRGMPMLKELRDAGFSIWPFDPPGWPLAVEIYPRLLTGPVNKSSREDREAYLTKEFPELYRDHHEDAASSEDAFDAAVSALVMAERVEELAKLSQSPDPCELIEGKIWY
jgi:hypothetical protein